MELDNINKILKSDKIYFIVDKYASIYDVENKNVIKSAINPKYTYYENKYAMDKDISYYCIEAKYKFKIGKYGYQETIFFKLEDYGITWDIDKKALRDKIKSS